MRLPLIIISIITAIIGLALSILPFGTIAILPIIIAFVSGFMAFKISRKENKGVNIIKGVFLIIIISLALTIYNSFKTNEIVEDTESIIKENQSEEDSIEELESIEIDD